MIYTGEAYFWLIFIISLAAIMVHLKRSRIGLAIASILLVLALMLIGFFSPLKAIDNPFTSQQFASWDDRNMFYRGTTTYFQRVGFILYSPQSTEYDEASGDDNYVRVSSNEIYVNSTFMGEGGTFRNNNDHINIKKRNVDEFILSKHSSTSWEYYQLTKNSLSYRGSRGNKTCPLTDAEYRQLRYELEHMELVEDERTNYYYELQVRINNDNASYYSVVDGEALCGYLYHFIVGDQPAVDPFPTDYVKIINESQQSRGLYLSSDMLSDDSEQMESQIIDRESYYEVTHCCIMGSQSYDISIMNDKGIGDTLQLDDNVYRITNVETWYLEDGESVHLEYVSGPETGYYELARGYSDNYYIPLVRDSFMLLETLYTGSLYFSKDCMVWVDDYNNLEETPLITLKEFFTSDAYMLGAQYGLGSHKMSLWCGVCPILKMKSEIYNNLRLFLRVKSSS